jgi:SAM-dependent methyltransferase
MKTVVDWHARFTQQAGWTASLRSHLYQAADLQAAGAVLEVGCGTGAILADLPARTKAQIHGLDLDLTRLNEARGHVPSARLVNGNTLELPYPGRIFDICMCQFLLLWVGDPLQALREMRRVTRPGGAILVMAEPDYSARVDTPQEMVRLGEMQTRSLHAQGADPDIGVRLPSLFSQAGIDLVKTGSLQRMTPESLSAEDWELEWDVLGSDLAGLLPDPELAALKQIDLQARLKGERTLFVPTHFAWGWV